MGRGGRLKTATSPDVLQSLRERAAARFEHLGWPTTQIEEWRYTSLAPIAKTQWSAPPPDSSLTLGMTSAASLVGRASVELVFLNGAFVSRSGDTRIGVTNLSSDGAAAEEHLGRYADFEQHAMVALNTANFRDGAVVEVPANTVVDGFIHLLFIGSGDGVWSHPRNLIIAGRNSQVAVVETYVGTGKYFTNAVTEVAAADGAVVDHYKIACESPGSFHVGTVQFHQQRSSSVTSRNVTVGSALVRHDVNAVLAGEGASLVLEGLYVVKGDQHVDNHTLIDHVSPHCESHELYKGILDENARGIFDGRIIVRPNAQKTISRQENRNLLLSESAIADSKPTLEIHNDDVKCNHGSTIGQIEDEPMFYLRSRGLSEEEARSLLVYAFAAEIVDRLKVEPVREQIRRALYTQLPDRRKAAR
jgi:Fe-S cluster assembly protein SufD